QLLDREVAGQPPAGHILRVVAPVLAPDSEDVPGDEDDDGRPQRPQQPLWRAPHPGPQHELQRQGDDEAPAHEEEVLELVHRAGTLRGGGHNPAPEPTAGYGPEYLNTRSSW